MEAVKETTEKIQKKANETLKEHDPKRYAASKENYLRERSRILNECVNEMEYQPEMQQAAVVDHHHQRFAQYCAMLNRNKRNGFVGDPSTFMEELLAYREQIRIQKLMTGPISEEALLLLGMELRHTETEDGHYTKTYVSNELVIQISGHVESKDNKVRINRTHGPVLLEGFANYTMKDLENLTEALRIKNFSKYAEAAEEPKGWLKKLFGWY